MSISEAIRLSSIYSFIIPLVVYALAFKKAKKPVHLIGGLIIASGISDFIALFKLPIISVALLCNIQDVIQFLLVSAFFYIISSNRIIIKWGVALYLPGLFVTSLFIQSPMVHQTLLWAITGFIILVFCIQYVIQVVCAFKVRPTADASLPDYSLLYIIGGFIIYFTLSLWLFIMGDYIFYGVTKDVALSYWSVHNFNNIIKNILIAIGIWHSGIFSMRAKVN